MTELDQPRQRRTRSRHELLTDVVLAVVLLLAATAVIVVERLDGRSGPVESGPFGGFVSFRGVVVARDGFTKRLATAPGTTARVLESLANLGDHAVTITSVETGDIVTRVRWSIYRTVPGGYTSGEPEPWHDFPTTITGQGRIRLEVTVRRPSYCDNPRNPRGFAVDLPGLAVHWQSPLDRHVSYISRPENLLRVC